MNFQPKISKEEINGLPLASFCGEIRVIDNDNDVAEAIDFLRQCSVVGIDTETKPAFLKGVHYKVALLQVATEELCYLFRLNMLTMEAENLIFHFLSDKKVMKVGLSLKDDFSRLHKLNSEQPANSLDLQTIAKQYGILELGLQKMFAIIFGKKISKSQRLTNWELGQLTPAQQRYAATDAWACLEMYNRLQQEKKLSKGQIDKLLAEYPANPNQNNQNNQNNKEKEENDNHNA
jgi:ribonuclease D